MDYGIGLVRLMGRDAGFIAMEATTASRDVNICLIPEFSFGNLFLRQIYTGLMEFWSTYTSN